MKKNIQINQKKLQGKRNRASGARFELKVRKDLEDKGWVVSKWMNNVLIQDLNENVELPNGKIKHLELKNFSLIPAKHKFRGPGIPMAIGTGFPDFIAFKLGEELSTPWGQHSRIVEQIKIPEVIGVECKINGYLKPEEKEKCKWLIDNNKFSKILIAKKGTKRGEITYNEY